MDSVAEIKLRLPIEQLVGQYCQLQKKGRNFVCLCPFHNDSNPSFLVSPDKGIAYCFACRSGGDVFSFYQKIENVEFPQALRELAEKAGVVLEDAPKVASVKKDEKERIRECLHAAVAIYRSRLPESKNAVTYLQKRGIPQEQIEQFEIGAAPDSFSATYDELLKRGFSKREILGAGLGVQRDLKDEHIYDRFRNRLMFPIHDAQGMIVGFGGRTLGDDDAKYINSSDGPLFHKSTVLFGMHHARDNIREQKRALLVEGYFDVLACHRVGATHAVATCGTALTESHGKLLRRYADTVTLCLDSDRAGKEAMERAFLVLCALGMHVEAVVLSDKDPADALLADAAALKQALASAKPYLDTVIEELRRADLSSPLERRNALKRLLPLLNAIPSSVERRDYLVKVASLFQTTEAALEADMTSSARETVVSAPKAEGTLASSDDLFSTIELALGMFFSYPQLRYLLAELIEPDDGLAAALYKALKAVPTEEKIDPQSLPLEPEDREKLGVLLLYCEHHGFSEWSEGMAIREIRKNCKRANKDMLHRKQEELTHRLVEASRDGKVTEQAQLQHQYQQVLLLLKMAS